jgi:hypothetical protein
MEQLAALLLLLALPLCGTAISNELLLQLLSLLVVDCTVSQFVVATEWWGSVVSLRTTCVGVGVSCGAGENVTKQCNNNNKSNHQAYVSSQQWQYSVVQNNKSA